ncbi:MAG: hypothetical protein LQ338_004049 [Usnochroma carphineum]|nr:MAG: hypothetical protein LQ338_004049 [Usnochroma carphineum]
MLALTNTVRQMARKLQDRLALASYKTQNGLDHLSLDMVKAHIENTLKRKRPASTIGTSSDSSSTTSDQPFFSGPLTSSPHTAAMFSDDFPSSVNGRTWSRRSGYKYTTTLAEQEPANRKRHRTQSMAPPLIDVSRRSWKSAHNLPASSPGLHQHAHFPFSHSTNVSFTSEAPTIPNTPPFGSDSDDKDHEHLGHSFNLNTSHFRSSPPCTPPPTNSRKSRSLKRNAVGEEGAELLMHLATSPSPATRGMKSNLHPPSTPPSDHQALPSSMMPMSGASGFLGGFSTPGQNFAWADFINVTPSPAQGAFGNSTPGLPKTPLAAKEARRRLNLDALGSSAGSPNLSNIGRGSTAKSNGLGMELGGELIS